MESQDDESKEAERLVQSALNLVMRRLGVVSGVATEASEAGGLRAARSQLALPHLEDAVAVVGVITRNAKGRVATELMEEIAMADRCLARAAAALNLDFEQL